MSSWKRTDAPLLGGPGHSRNASVRAILPRPRALLPIFLTALSTSVITYSYAGWRASVPAMPARCDAPTPALALAPLLLPSGMMTIPVDAARSRQAAAAQTVTETVSMVVPAPYEPPPGMTLLPVMSVASLEQAARTRMGEHADAEPGELSTNLRGSPTRRFRDNLLPNRKYITTFHDAGWTNQVMSIANMIYLGVQTGRIPILPQFTAMDHLGAEVGSVAFAEVFDEPRLARALGLDVIDWVDVKEFPSPGALQNDGYDVEGESLGCWSAWAGIKESNGQTQRQGRVPGLLGLDISWTPTPDSAALGHNSHVHFWGLAQLGYPDGRRAALEQVSARTAPSYAGQKLVPDDQLLCFDFLYFACAREPFEIEREWSPVWKTVLTHLHWTPRLEGIIEDALGQIFGLASTTPIPPFVAVHVRRGDFSIHCPGQSAGECFAPLSAYADAVAEARAELLANTGLDAQHVLVASDETSPAWWAKVSARGWRRVDHGPTALDTAARHGRWYEVFIDAGVLARADALVGTHDSTMSLLAARRVRDWRGGVSRVVLPPRLMH